MPRRTKRKSKPKRRPRNASPEWFEIKQVLDERFEGGKTLYLIDWAGTDDKGNPWPPSWQEEVTADEIEKWEERKRNRALPQTESTNKRLISEVDSDDEDEPILQQRRRKLPRLQIPSEAPTLSLPSTAIQSEVGTPILQADPRPLHNQQLLVAIKEAAIDRSEYLSISTTQSSSQLISELEEEDSRIVITSQNSQTTIPDSQNLSADIWSQSQIPSIGAVEVSEHQSVSDHGNSLVIPDSQDLSLNFSTSEHSASQEQDLLLRNGNTPERSHPEVVPDSVRAEVDIPSHQPEHSSNRESSLIEHCDLLTAECTSHESDHQTPIGPTSDTHQPPNSEPSPTEPVFLSQVPVALDTSLESSGPTLILESSRDRGNGVAIEDQGSQEGHPGLENAESQAAQVVSFDLETVDDNSANSLEIVSEAPNSEAPPSSQIHVREEIVGDSSTQPSASQPTNTSPALPQIPRATGTTMEGGGRLSAADEIRRLLGEIDPDLQDAIGGVPSGSLSEPGPFLSGHDEVETINPSATVRSPQLQDQSSLLSRNDQWNADVLLNENEHFVVPVSISPASLMNPRPSAHDEIMNLVDSTFDDPMPSIASTLMPDISSLHPTTISPADMLNPLGSAEASHTLLPLSDNGTLSSRLDHSSGQSITMGQIPADNSFDEASSPIQPEAGIAQHLVTLPFQASRRPVYDELVSKYRLDAETFSRYFSGGTSDEPGEALVKRIDEFLSELTNICDYPQHLVGTTLEELPADKQAKYVRDANPKFNFVFEFLKDIRKDTEILIVAGTPELLRLLFTLTEDLELECTSESIGKLDSEYQGSAARIQLVLATEEHDPFPYNVVIGFDTLFSDSLVAKALNRGSASSSPLLLLQLATIHSIEHIAQHIPSDLTALERRNALLLGIAKARSLVKTPKDNKDHEPHTAAQVFSDYVNELTDIVQWEPMPMPNKVVELFVSSQFRAQIPQGIAQGVGLKHRLDDDDPCEDAKRIRLSPTRDMTTEPNNPPIPDSVRSLLKSAESKTAAHNLREAKIHVPIAAMLVIAEQVSELRRQSEDKKVDTDFREGVISGLEKRVEEYERTTNKIGDSYRKALEDRHNYEKEALGAKSAVKAVQDAADQESARTKKRISDLEERIAVLTATPEGSHDDSVAKLNQLLNEAKDKIQLLERRVENASNDGNYVRDEYQKATARATALNSENKELAETNAELTKQASENLVKIQQIHQDETIKEYLKTIEALKSQLKNKDAELDQLRVLKNGRPQTRQASVPRSPRTIMMSPRPGRYGNSASRGTSPAAPGYDGNGSGGVPGKQYTNQQSGNGRWDHLRD